MCALHHQDDDSVSFMLFAVTEECPQGALLQTHPSTTVSGYTHLHAHTLGIKYITGSIYHTHTHTHTQKEIAAS